MLLSSNLIDLFFSFLFFFFCINIFSKLLFQLFSESPALKDVEKRQRKLRSQLNAVSKKLSDVILENQPSYTKVSLVAAPSHVSEIVQQFISRRFTSSFVMSCLSAK